MSETTIHLELGHHRYTIHVGEGVLSQVPDELTRLGIKGTIGIVTDTTVGQLYADSVQALVEGTGLNCVCHAIPAGEKNKRLAEMEAICGTFLEGGLDRASLIIALGGGVVGDMAGYAAASFMRGIPFIQIPTTILAQVDSSVGGKTGVNHPLGKNTIGAFYQPEAVLIDLTLLNTLHDRELRAGLAEVIKHGVIADEKLFAYCEENAAALLNKDLDALRYPIVRSCEIKAAVVAEDEKEQGKRANLNYGHTFGHGIESASHYNTFLHGEAVAIGMCAAGAMARNLGLVDDAFVARQEACCQACGLPTRWPEMPVDETIHAMRKDKKARAGTLKFVLPDALGHVIHRTDITEDQVRAALEAVR